MGSHFPLGTPPASWWAVAAAAGVVVLVIIAPALHVHPAWILVGALAAVYAVFSPTLRNTNRKDHHHD